VREEREGWRVSTLSECEYATYVKTAWTRHSCALRRKDMLRQTQAEALRHVVVSGACGAAKRAAGSPIILAALVRLI
jgi:hypothetical protein